MRITNTSVDLKFSDDMDFIIDKDTKDLKKAYEFNGEVSSQMIIKRAFMNAQIFLNSKFFLLSFDHYINIMIISIYKIVNII